MTRSRNQILSFARNATSQRLAIKFATIAEHTIKNKSWLKKQAPSNNKQTNYVCVLFLDYWLLLTRTNMNRHLSRMIAMQTLFEWEFRHETDLEDIVDRNIGEYKDKCEDDFVLRLVHGVAKDKEKLDNIINKSAPEWPVDQISLIDHTILRLSVHELLELTDVPPKVAINEAVELSKEFGGENSSKFVNGVLGTVYKQYEKEIESIRSENHK